MTVSDIEEYSLRSIAVLGGDMHSQITLGNVTLPKAVLIAVKIFAVWVILLLTKALSIIFYNPGASTNLPTLYMYVL